ncbi:outer membrane protein assembly factor BamB family protein [Spirosoma endbachense]|uniref:PQQ-binding-like beta-propeller repeat protein n=1 Tax=Spirosoma endbachense TaxID=2666025 RepID=A0A6P1W037_9BACT|nr:PQQ-binding-like beta-propeller repeat protein [Spirosoma endbachense]QHV97397.1 PQQ-binding-like beta-propeller repeat protein [Spirosoma endbachense]
MTFTRIKYAFSLVVLGVFLVSLTDFPKKLYLDWRTYGGNSENNKYSDLKQIDTSNVDQLKVAWVYRSENGDSTRFGPMESNPIIIGKTLFAVSAKLKLFAIDAATGKRKWEFNPADSSTNRTWYENYATPMNRGVAYWTEGDDSRVLFACGNIVYAVNATTGRLVPTFGKNGGVDLREGLGRDPKTVSMSPTSPVLIYKNLFITSGLNGGYTPGDIRGFDVKTGEQKWAFHTIPYPGEFGYDTWEDKTAYQRLGSTNAWSGFSLDSKRGILYAGIGSPTNDMYGGARLGKGLFGNCLVALDAQTGKRIWHFQTVHHDVWDMDVSSPPALLTLTRNGKKVDAVAQTTKTGMIFVFDRVTGKPLFPIKEIPVLTDGVEGEKLHPTQPFPVLPKPFARQILTEKDLNPLVSAEEQEQIRQRFRTYRSQGIYTPPSEQGTIILPGYDGGGEWGGPTVDPTSNILYVNANEMAWVQTLVRMQRGGKKLTNLEAGSFLYKKNCMICHGPELLGSGDFPKLIGVDQKYTLDQFNQLLKTGKTRMPGFAQLSLEEKTAIGSFVLNLKAEQEKPYTGRAIESKDPSKPDYSFTGYNKFLTKDGYPAISPPWGTINAIDLNTGKYVWKIPFGEFEELKKKGIPTTGRENYGGSVVTAGGLLFIGASADGKFRAFNKKTGKLLWETDLPAAGVATPAVYAIDGRQYVVIACGGSKWDRKRSSDAYVAFTLPEK